MDDFKNYYNSVQLFIIDAKQQSRDWTKTLIASICNEKLVADYEDYSESKQYQPLKKYLVEFFLKHFGCRRLAIGSLKDFIFSMKSWYKNCDRMTLFMDLAGLSELKNVKDDTGSSMQGKSSHLSGVRMKSLFYESTTPLKVYLRICQLFKNRVGITNPTEKMNSLF